MPDLAAIIFSLENVSVKEEDHKMAIEDLKGRVWESDKFTLK